MSSLQRNWIYLYENQGHDIKYILNIISKIFLSIKQYFQRKQYMKRRKFNKDHFEDVNPVKIHGKRLLAKLGEIYHTYLSRLMASMNSDS